MRGRLNLPHLYIVRGVRPAHHNFDEPRLGAQGAPYVIPCFRLPESHHHGRMSKPLPFGHAPSCFSLRELTQRLHKLLPRDALLDSPEDLHPYECDGPSAYRRLPGQELLTEIRELP